MLDSPCAKYLALAGFLAALCVLPHFLKYHHQDFLIFLVINILVVISYRLVTLTGEWSLIHAIMMGVGAYTSALLAKHYEITFWLSMPLGGLMAGSIAALLCFPLFRMTQFYFLIGSFATGEAIRLCWIHFVVPFGGTGGLSGIPVPELGSIDFFLTHPLLLSGIDDCCAVPICSVPHRKISHWTDTTCRALESATCRISGR